MDNMKNPWRKLSILLFMWLSLCKLSFGADTITANQSLSGNQTIVSSGGNFVLGFFAPGSSSNYYIGIWYGKISEQTPVWVANRDTPVRDIHSSELKISDGNLVLTNGSQVEIWSTNISSSNSSSVVAVLEDGGNLVLRDGPNSSAPLWQSLDHPAHTWLPGCKLSLNKRTNRSQLLTSWKNSEDPAPGLFSLELDPAGANSYIIRWNGTRQYWSSGPWDEQSRIFRDVPEMRLNYLSNINFLYNFSFHSDENESYFTYSLDTNQITTRLIMHYSGQIQQQSWLESNRQWNLFWSMPSQQCQVYAFCGAFGSCNEISLPFCSCLRGFHPKSETNWNLSDFSDGCERTTRLQCEEDPNLVTGKTDKFLESPNVKLPERAKAMSVGSMLECESACLEYCNCTAYAYDSDGCQIWMTELLDLQQYSGDTSDGRTIYIRLAASEFRSSSNNNGIIIGAVAGGIGLVLCLVIFAILRWRRRRMINPKVEGSLLAFGYRDTECNEEFF